MAVRSLIEQNSSELTYLRNQSIISRYQSKVRRNNILDKSQQSIIDFYQSLDKKRMLVSAPTSYGKTSIMREILFLNRESYNNVLLVFPTVALLRENALNMEELNREKEMGYKIIKSIDGEINSQERNIFVFTPERAMQLLASYPDIKIDFFFYDEMYKIDEDYCNEETDVNFENSKKNPYREQTFLDEARAKTFRICLYILSKRVDDYYLAGPNLKRDKFGKGMQRYIETNEIKIKEIEFEPTKRIQVKAYNKIIDEDYKDLPYLEKPEMVKMHRKVNDRICDVVEYIEKRGYGATMLYCTTPSKANENATKLAQRHQERVITNNRFLVFIEHLKRNYNIDVLDPIDIDNSEYNDLSYENKILKQKRLEEQRDYILTDEVYEKNRLIKKEYQEVLLKFLIISDTLYNKFYNYTTFPDILTQFTTYHAMSTILDIFEQSGLLEEKIVSRYKAISNTYCSEGFRGLLKYEIDNARKDKYDKYGNKVKNKSIDRAYMDAFKTQKEIIEHKIPKMLALFETIFYMHLHLKGEN